MKLECLFTAFRGTWDYTTHGGQTATASTTLAYTVYGNPPLSTCLFFNENDPPCFSCDCNRDQNLTALLHYNSVGALKC